MLERFKNIPKADDKTPSRLKTIEKPITKLKDTKKPSNLEFEMLNV